MAKLSSKTTPTYQELSAELASLMLKLEQGDLDIDEAVACYARGLEIVKLLEKHLLLAEHKVNELKAATTGSDDEED